MRFWDWVRGLFKKPPAVVEIAPRIEPRTSFSVSISALLELQRRTDQGPHFARLDEIFAMAKPMPGVLPKMLPNDVKQAYDDVSGMYEGLVSDGGYNERLAWFGMPYLSQLTQRPEYRRPSEIIAKTMTRKWIKLVSSGDEDKTEKLSKIEAALKQFKVQELFRRIAEHDGWFGRAHLFIDLGDDEKSEELATLLVVDKRKIKKGTLKGFRTVEPLWTYPAMYDTLNPLSPAFYKPIAWYVMGFQVHRSRLLTFVSREMPDILKPAYQFGGLSLSQLSKPYIDNWLRTRQSVSDIIHSFSVMVLHTQMGEVLNSGGAAMLASRLALFTTTRDNKGVFAVQKDEELLENVSAPLSGLDHLQAQSQEQMASVNGIPLIVQFGLTPSGLNATAEPEIRVFYDWCHAQQEHLFRPHLKTVLDIIQLNEFGEIDETIDFEFRPLWQLDEAGIAAVQKTEADTDAVYLQEGVVSPDDVRSRLSGKAGSLYQGLEGDAPPKPDLDADVDTSDPSEQIDKQAESGSETGANSGA